MGAPTEVVRLVEQFRNDEHAIKSAAFKEARVRREYIDPLFEALGWDVSNLKGSAQVHREVVHEDVLRVSSRVTAPDYGFYIGGDRKFYVEAKKPFINLKESRESAFQLRSYGWSAKLPLSVLTDFDEFAVYECRIRPQLEDPPSKGRTRYFRYQEYLDRWDEIANLFSREAVLSGSLEAWEPEIKKGVAPVDQSFLKEVEDWREMLAKALYRLNPWLSRRDLNYAVQMTIDRIVFIRVCEDRGLEESGELRSLLSKSEVYVSLCSMFRAADDRYNSGLFHFREEKGRDEPPDDLTLSLKIDDKSLKGIIERLYPPRSPYQFSVIPVEILGQVYEQFLGRVITINTNHQVAIDEKPEVKKAGGVYYTPSYVVDYIVRNTVGRLVEGKTVRQVSQLKILDPAAGSGSFLIGAYDFLLEWHRKRYVEEGPEKHSKVLYEGSSGEWRLTNEEKKRILRNNIFGVDIDTQAVEVTKLSLLLKVLEGETDDNVSRQLTFFKERALPDLGDNIKCGNSLIGPNFYDDQPMALFDEEERIRINVFDWEQEFPEVMAAGGFDAIIGNPPWLMAGYYVTNGLEYLREHFDSAQGKFDMYYLFIEQGCNLLRDDGFFGMIVPNKFFHTKAASHLRTLIGQPKWVRAIVDFGSEQVFSTATNYSCLLFLQKNAGSPPTYVKAREGIIAVQEFEVPWSVLTAEPWHFVDQRARTLFEKVEEVGEPLDSIAARFGTGVQSGADRLLMVDPATAHAQGLEDALLRPVLRGRDVRRYAVSDQPKLLVFPYKVEAGEFTILSESVLQEYEGVYSLLKASKQQLSKRTWFGKGPQELSGKWYGMVYLDAYRSFSTPHILTPSLSNKSNFALGNGDLFATGTAGVTSFIPASEVRESITYLLGLLNSSLLSFYAISHSPVFSGGYYKFSAPYLRKLPIRLINFSDPVDKDRHNLMVGLVEQMLELHEQLSSARTSNESTLLKREISYIDQRIDRLVYELYDLTDEEIRVVNS